jgi:hypothetical protein
MNDELKKVCKEAVVASSRYLPGICQEELRKLTKSLSQDSFCNG